jgi:hypothetical protein
MACFSIIANSGGRASETLRGRIAAENVVDQEFLDGATNYVKSVGHESDPRGMVFIDVLVRDMLVHGRDVCAICGADKRSHILRALRKRGPLEHVFKYAGDRRRIFYGVAKGKVLRAITAASRITRGAMRDEQIAARVEIFRALGLSPSGKLIPAGPELRNIERAMDAASLQIMTEHQRQLCAESGTPAHKFLVAWHAAQDDDNPLSPRNGNPSQPIPRMPGSTTTSQ